MQTNAEPVNRPTRLRFVFDLITTVALLAGVGFVIWTNWPKLQPSRKVVILPRNPVSLDGAATLGSATAPVILLTYTDFQCPFCGRFARDTMPKIRKDYVDTGKIQIAIRNLPLPIHSLAPGAAVAAVCAKRQGRFWEMHDLIFQDQKHLEAADLTRRAAQIGLDVPAFEHCRDEPTATAELETDRRSAEALHINSTPISLIGIRQRDGRVRLVQEVTGAAPFEAVSKQLDATLQSGTPDGSLLNVATGSLACAVTLAAAVWWLRRRRHQPA